MSPLLLAILLLVGLTTASLALLLWPPRETAEIAPATPPTIEDTTPSPPPAPAEGTSLSPPLAPPAQADAPPSH